jgi:hypothetical protein
MRREISIMIILALACSLVLVSGLTAQVRPNYKESSMDKVEGMVVEIEKDKSIIRIRQATTTNALWDIVFNDQTKFTYRNSPSSFDEVKVNRRVICLGKIDGKRLTAVRVDIRSKG